MKPTLLVNRLLHVALFSFFCLSLQAQIPQLISYQGILTSTDGTVVPDGTYTITVKLFDAETGGNELWSEDHSVNTVNGLFAVNLGSNTALNLPFDQAYFASTTVDGNELSPRTALTASPYAFSANTTASNPFALDNADGSEQEVVFVDNNSNVGVGTNQPTTQLHVQSAPGVKSELFMDPGNWNFNGDEAQITLGDFNHRITTAFGLGTTYYDVDQFRFEGSSVTFEERVTIGLQSGPGTLHVNGNISVQDDSNIFGLDGLWGFNDLRFFGDLNGAENGGDLIIKEDGKVGIGLFEPQEILHINGNLHLGPDSDILSIDRLVGDNDLRLFGDPPADGESEDMYISTDGKVSVGTATNGNELLAQFQVNGPAGTAALLEGSELKLLGPGTAHFSILNGQDDLLKIQNTSNLAQPGTPGFDMVVIGDNGFGSTRMTIGPNPGELHVLSVHSAESDFFVPDWTGGITTTIGGVFRGFGLQPQVRFAEDDLGTDFFDIGMDGASNFVIEHQDNPLFILDTAGNLNVTGNIFSASDGRYKKNIQRVAAVLPHLMQISAYHYDWDQQEFPDKGFTTERQLGFIAQELEASFPELVHTNQAGYKGVDYSRMAPILVEAIKEQQTQIEQLKAEKAALEAELQSLRSEVISRLEALENKSAKGNAPSNK